jgi:16S rRNA (cytosine1402-N4)-methyltransferase
MTIRHLPVLRREVFEIIAPLKGGIYIDATIGLGGHSGEILKVIGQDGRVVGIDRDEEAIKSTEEKLNDSRLILKRGSFSDIENVLHSLDIKEADGILFDLGVSMIQLKDLKRGFSFYSDAKLNMRMDAAQDFSAWDVVNRYSEKELVRILKEYGEEHRALRIARAIAGYRGKKSIDTCSELAEIVKHAVGRRGKIHPATKTFQALRIEVNKELEELQNGLEISLSILKRGGRLCVISYHSLEDRIVKNFIRDNAKKSLLRPLLKKPLCSSTEEIRANPSSRSAKLRGAERL